MPTTSCAQCSAPLADDQRYCLQCGEARPNVNGPLSKPLATPLSPAPVVPPSLPGSGSKGPSTRNNSLALIAGVGVLLLAMGVGVLIGRAGVGSAKAPPAQVISLGGAAGATGAATTPVTSTPASETPATPATKKESKAKQAPAKDSSSITKPAPSSAAKNLRSGGNGESYEQKSKNLPNVVSTG